MSLVNDMLRDLDRRKSTYPQQQDASEGVRVTAAINSRDKRFAQNWVWLIVAIGVLLLAAFAWHLYGQLAAGILPSKELSVEPGVVPVVVNDPVIVPPVIEPKHPAFIEILSVHVHAVTGGARIEISLSAPVQHRVLRNGQQLIIDLPATRLAEALSNLTRHPLIDAVDVLTHSTGTQLEVDVTRPIKIQTSLVSKQQTLLMVELMAVSNALPTVATGNNKKIAHTNDERLGVDAVQQPVAEAPTVANKTVGASFEKTSRQLTLGERDERANRQALQQMRSGRTEAAQQLLTELLAEYPGAHQSRATLIALKLSQEQFELAQQLLVNGLQLAPEKLSFIKLKARLLLSQQRHAEAVAELDLYQQQGEKDQEFLALLATAAQRDGQHQRAATLYQQLLKRNDRQAQWWMGLAISLETLQQKSAALAAYMRARELPGISSALKSYAESRIAQLK